MGVGAPPPPRPVASIAGSGMGEPISMPVLRRPLGWRELDGKTLLLRAHGLIAAQCEPVCWLDDKVVDIQDVSSERSAVAASKNRLQLSSSDNFLFEELSRIETFTKAQKREYISDQKPPPKNGSRYSGLILTASLVLVALQFALFLVAINPQEVIENVETSIRQWQINLPDTGSASSEGSTQLKDKAAWWQSWQQTFMPEIFSSPNDAAFPGSQAKPRPAESVK